MANVGLTVLLVDASGKAITSLLAPLEAGGVSNPLDVRLMGSIPEAAGTQVADSTTAAAGTANSAVLPAVAGETTYLRGFAISSAIPAAAHSGLLTLSGVVGGPLFFEFNELIQGQSVMTVSFVPGLAASGQNQVITLSLPAITGGGATAIAMWGVQL